MKRATKSFVMISQDPLLIAIMLHLHQLLSDRFQKKKRKILLAFLMGGKKKMKQ